jgi:hypothetical protein
MLPDPRTHIEVSPAEVASWIQLPPQERPRLVSTNWTLSMLLLNTENHPLANFP